jgi:hypothetical protein
MSFIDFLSENYVWIIIIILLGIITIIGFVADSNNKKKKNTEITNNQNNNAIPNGQNFLETNTNINQPNNNLVNPINVNSSNNLGNNINQGGTPVANVNQSTNNLVNPTNINSSSSLGNNISQVGMGHTSLNSSLMNSDQPTNKVNSMGYVPLSEQKPSVTPTFNGSSNITSLNNEVSSAHPQVNNIQYQNSWEQPATNNQTNNLINNQMGINNTVEGPKAIEPQPIIVPNTTVSNGYSSTQQNTVNSSSNMNSVPFVNNQFGQPNQFVGPTPNQFVSSNVNQGQFNNNMTFNNTSIPNSNYSNQYSQNPDNKF